VFAMSAVTACGKNVPLANSDATTNDPRCMSAHYDGEPCTDEGLTCKDPASCGFDVSTCMGGIWSTIRCQAKHCPCLSQADCDLDGQCGADGICHPTTTPSCGGLGTRCCGGACGTCVGGLVCTDGTCGPGSGTLGAACVAKCDGTSNCDQGQYCPDSCLQCPCSDSCRSQGTICTFGDDHSCNDDPMDPTLHGVCVAGHGPFATTCTCTSPSTIDPHTGKCM
jgi:hypothetical protein